MERIFLLLMLLHSAIGHPKTSQIFDLQNVSPPEEINQLSYADLDHPNHSLNLNDIGDIVLQVEQLISSHPNLPRLTRGEILDLLENITTSDLEQYQREHIDNKPRGRNPKAYMVVKAYSPEGDEASKMEELFTKTPVTQIVATKDQNGKEVGPSEDKDTTNGLNKKIHRGRKRTTTTTSVPIMDTSTTGLATTSSPDVTQRFQPSTYSEKPATITHHRRRRPTQSNDLERTRKVSTTETPITTYSYRRRRPITRNHVSSTTEKYQNHRYPGQEERNKIPSSVLPFGEKVAEPSQQYDPYNSNDDLIMMENSRKEVPLALTVKTEPPYYQRSSTGIPDIEPFIPQEALFDQASSSTKIHSSRLAYHQAPGYIADLETSPAENIAVSRLTSTVPPSTTVPDISPVADNLSSEMRDLLVSFGLIQGPRPIEDVKKDDAYNPEKAEVDPGSYVGFKPLPANNDESRSDMDILLARFGLGRNSKSQQQSERRSDESSDDRMTFDVVPQQYQGVLEDIGLSTRQGKKIRTEALTKTLEKINEYTPPKADSNQEEIEKLNKLLNIIQKIEKLNKTLTNDDVDNEQLREVVESLNVTPLDQQNAPNPLNYDNGLSKNEIKREQNDKDAATAAVKVQQEQVQVVTPSVKLNSDETASATASAPAKEEAVTPNLKDLEDSFGGKTDPPTEPPATETATKRTGFYYLVDWNTFLEVDDQKGKRVNLRFQPTIGDPKRFYSVSVP